MTFYRSVEQLPELKPLSKEQRSQVIEEAWRHRPSSVEWIRWSAFVIGPLIGAFVAWVFIWPVRGLWEVIFAIMWCAVCGRLCTLVGAHFQIKRLRPLVAASVEGILTKTQ